MTGFCRELALGVETGVVADEAEVGAAEVAGHLQHGGQEGVGERLLAGPPLLENT